MVYCTGGNDGTNSLKSAYVFDPGANAWTAVAEAPADTWAAAYAVASGTLLVNGGVQGGAVTNRVRLRPRRRRLVGPAQLQPARYRGGMACGFYKIGGSSGGFTATVDSETLPGFEDCGASAADVEWMTIDKTSATLAPASRQRSG